MQCEVDITDLGHQGEGIGRLEGKAVFVDGALPGERVSVEIVVEKERYAKGKLLEVITPSKNRALPICPYFGSCGGCQLMHLDYPAQLEIKRQRVQETMRRIGGLDVNVEACAPSPKDLGYRNKILLPVRDSIGLYAKGSHQVIPIDSCLIHNERGDGIYPDVVALLEGISHYDEQTGKGELRHLLIRTGDRILVGLITTGKPSPKLKDAAKAIAKLPEVAGVTHAINRRRDNVIMDAPFKPLVGDDFIFEEVCGLKFKLSAGAFFQVNPLQAEQIYLEALKRAEIQETDSVIDAYCGVGTMACIFAKQCQSVLGIEVVPQAIADAKVNAGINKITNARFTCGRTESVLPDQADVVILNPPRKGCDPRVLQKLAKMRPRVIVYISCHPATLARDLKLLVDEGFRVGSVTPYDMFPQTSHVETLSLIYS